MVLLTVPCAIGEEWVYVVTSKKNKIESFVDADSITGDGNLKRFMMYHKIRGYKKFRGIPIETLIGKTVVNCADETIGYEEERLELRGGNLAVREMKLPAKSCRVSQWKLKDSGVIVDARYFGDIFLGLKWAFKKLPKSIPEALKKDLGLWLD